MNGIYRAVLSSHSPINHIKQKQQQQQKQNKENKQANDQLDGLFRTNDCHSFTVNMVVVFFFSSLQLTAVLSQQHTHIRMTNVLTTMQERESKRKIKTMQRKQNNGPK